MNAAANQTAQTPFQTYSGSGAAVAPGYSAGNTGNFVAPVNAQQQSGIAATNAAAGQAQPYYNAATGVLGATQNATTGANNAAEKATQANSSGLSASQIQQYLSPYLGTVLGSTEALQNQENQQQQAGQLGNAISSGAFGGDRTGIAAANLAQQQQLANSNVLAGIANTGYQSALGTAQQEQQLGLAGAQQLANIGQTAYGEGANTANTLAGLGAGAQSAGLQGANAEIAAGTVEQQTQQAQDAAEYNQFLQQQSYPFQVDQFLADIAEGTSDRGTTTTTTQPGGLFSDKRLKHDIKRIGKTYDGQPIYSYKMHGDERTHIGLIAQQVEKRHPDAIGLASGYKTVDYGKATDDAAHRGHFYAGGLARVSRAGGGPSIVDPADLAAILRAQQAMYAPYSGGSAPYGGTSSLPHGGLAHVPAPTGARPTLVTASGGLRPQPSPAQNAASITDIATKANKLYKDVRGTPASDNQDPDMPGLAAGGRAHFDDGGIADVLAAQQAMYQRPNAQQRDIPAQAQQPQLAVASGSPQAPPSGASNLSQTLQSANDGYNLYKKIHPSSSTPSSVLPNGSSTTAPTIDYSSELSAPIDTGGVDAAAPAAIDTGAADAATGAAADTAGTAIAGGAADAAVGAGVDAAATDAAATLAADVLPLVLAAAAKGGAIRPRYDAGGMPYSNDGTLDIPDTQSGAPKLQTAGPIKKIPTGLEDITSMSNPMSAGTNMASMFSNQAVARGGLIARKGYQDGSSVDDPDRTPAQGLASPPAVDAQAPSTSADVPVAAAPAAAPAAAATPPSPPQHLDNSRGQQSDKTPSPPDKPRGLAAIKQWWDDNKGYALPAIEGLSAAGTASTVHPLTALAAGLGAGARAYVPTQQGLADTQYTQAETAGQLAQNRITNAKAGLTENYANGILHPQAGLVPQPASSSSSMPAPPTGAQATAQSLDQWARDALFVPLYRGDEQQKIERAKAMDGIMGTHTADALEFDRKTRYDREVQANQNLAQHWDDAFVDQYHRAPPKSQAALAALAVHNALMQWTGDKYGESGNRYNSRTNAPGEGNAGGQLTPQELAAIRERGLDLADVKTNDPNKILQRPRYTTVAPSLGGYQSQVVGDQLPMPATMGGVGAAAAPSSAPTQQTSASAVSDRAPVPVERRRPVVPVSTTQYTSRPWISKDDDVPTQKAFSDETYRAKKRQLKTMESADSDELFATELTNENRKAITNWAADIQQRVPRALENAKAAMKIMDERPPVTGLPGEYLTKFSRANNGKQATNYEELAKFLGNLAVNNGQSNFKDPTEKENDMQVNHLSPAVTQTGQTLRDLLANNLGNLQYDLDTATRAKRFLDTDGYNGDAKAFYDWNQKYFNRDSLVPITYTTVNKMPNDATLKAWADANKMKLEDARDLFQKARYQ